MGDSNNLRRRHSKKNLITTGLVAVSMAIGFAGYFVISGRGVTEFVYSIRGHFFWMLIFMVPWPLAYWVTRKWPADKDQPQFSSNLIIDLVYHFIRFAASVSLLVAVLPAAKLFYDRFLSFLTIEVSTDFPVWLRVICLLLFVDFIEWANHNLRHRIKLIWHFHSVHHSQTELNYFSDSRVHVFERIWSTLLTFIPTFMIQIPAPSIVIVLTLLSYQRFFYHSNWRSNFGILRYIFVTPQSHRIHHSRLPEHQNKNFGVNFSIWDHLFGTQYRSYDEYPETGIDDPDFPVEAGTGFLDIADSFGAQFIYPFERTFDSVRGFARSLRRRASGQFASWILPI